MFSLLEAAPSDPLLSIAVQFAADRNPRKLDLGIGVYRDESGNTPVMHAVRAAESQLLQQQRSKVYLPQVGRAEFNQAIAEMVLGSAHPAMNAARTAVVQTPGGCGALRLAMELSRIAGARRVCVSSPAWANHEPIIRAAGLDVVRYPYLDARSGQVAFAAMMDVLRTQPAGTPVLLQGCGHNPTGADLSQSQYAALAAGISAAGLVPLVDMAYHGLCDDLEKDVAGMRLLLERMPEALVAVSCSKNFAIYSERVGALLITADAPAGAAHAASHVLRVARTMHSMPPDHGAAIVALIWQSSALRSLWLTELNGMQTRLRRLRSRLAQELCARGLTQIGEAVACQHGLFSQLPLRREQIAQMRVEHHVYIAPDGRINVAGIAEARIEELATLLARVASTTP